MLAPGLLVAALASPAVAQDEAVVDALAGILAAEDQRRYDAPLLAAAARHPQSVVRRHAALAMGRIRDPAATPLLLELVADPDTLVQQHAAFALGLVADASSLPALRDLVLGTPPPAQTGTHLELVTAIAKTGPAAAPILQAILERWQPQGRGTAVPAAAVRALGESWRLGSSAPLAALLQAGGSGDALARRWALYALSRLRAPAGAPLLLAATADRDAEIRQHAARALTAPYADAAGLDRTALASRLTQLADDPDPGVRITALQALATFEDPLLAAAAADRISDSDPNVRVQAITTLGVLGGSEAPAVLAPQVDRGLYATRRAALLGLARVDRATALRKSAAWITNDDWLIRATGAEALGTIGGDTAVAWLVELTQDPDPRAVARAFRALREPAPRRAAVLAVELLASDDAVVRAAAADHLRDHARGVHGGPLVDALERALDDSIPQARLAAIEALGAVATLGVAERLAVEEAVLARVPAIDDYLARRAAARHLPGVALRWGAAHPIETGRDIGAYRDIARRYIVPPPRERPPGLVVETDRGRIGIALFGADAPLTVHALLELADRLYFDGGAWHRVVPNFVIQDGDPRGDGWGGPGFVLRDEINRHRYERGSVGIALDGPDTGGSQFFITYGPQPHLDGTYAVVGRVDSGMEVLHRITQGDRTRSVRRR